MNLQYEALKQDLRETQTIHPCYDVNVNKHR